VRYAVVLLLLPALVQENEAEKLYRQMEKKVVSAKVVKFVVDTEMKAPVQDVKIMGTILLGGDDKARMDLEADVNGKQIAFQLVSDGKRMRTEAKGLDKKEEKDTPKGFGTMLRAMMVPAGAIVVVRGADKPLTEEKLKISDFQLAGDEKVGDQKAKVIKYKFMPEEKLMVDATLWLDAKTLLPLKRTLVVGKDGMEAAKVTETYKEVTLDPKIDAKTFDLP
jgi:outer membrane lipoprotein-sorting protein